MVINFLYFRHTADRQIYTSNILISDTRQINRSTPQTYSFNERKQKEQSTSREYTKIIDLLIFQGLNTHKLQDGSCSVVLSEQRDWNVQRTENPSLLWKITLFSLAKFVFVLYPKHLFDWHNLKAKPLK